MRSQSFRIRTGNFALRAEKFFRHMFPRRSSNAAHAERNFSFNRERNIDSTAVHDQLDGKNTGVSLLKLGDTVMKESGCEVIAAYNALLLLGKRVSIAETARRFEEKGCLMRFPFVKYGTLGVNPYDIGSVLTSYGLEWSPAALEDMSEDGLYIISYWNDAKLRAGLHTITVRTDRELCFLYNYTMRGRTGTIMPYPSFLNRFRDGFIAGYRIEDPPEH